MEPTICPWCQTEIVWDEEIGPEEHCPHCENELKGFRTLSIALEGDDAEESAEDAYDDPEEESGSLNMPLWGTEDGTVPAIRTLDKYRDDHDLMAYEESVEKILDHQEETPECFQCREYMLHAGTQTVNGEGFTPAVAEGLKNALLKPPFTLDMYVCPGCFQVQYTLAEDERLRLIQELAGNGKNRK